MVHRFDDAEKWAGVFDDPKRDAWQRPDEVVRALELSPGMTVADIGAGTGYFIGRLSRAVGEGGKVVATDIEPNLVDYMKKRAEREKLANVDVVQVGPSEAGLAPASVDRVLIVDVWHHIGNRSQYASQLAASLKRGGFVAIVDFTLESDHGPPRHHRLAPEAVIAELRAGGLEATVIDEALPDQYIVVGRIAQGK